MYKILEKRELCPSVTEFVIHAPDISRAAKAGQFIIVRPCDRSERIPLTIADYDSKSRITVIFQEVGKTTRELGNLDAGGNILDIIGPLGKPTPVRAAGTVVCIGGGIGIAALYPVERAFKNAGNKVISIIGARSREFLIWTEPVKSVSDVLHITTDDGSMGRKGFVSDELSHLLSKGETVDLVFAVGPPVMMWSVCRLTLPPKLKTIVSLNPIMVDGTGMCGACRVEVGGETKFACVDGPDFDGHKVNFELLISRLKMYLEEEKK